MADKKSFDEEIRIAEKGAESLKGKIDKISELENRIIELEKRVSTFEKIIGTLDKSISNCDHDVLVLKMSDRNNSDILDMHTENFKEVTSSLESLSSINNTNEEKFRKHVNNLDAHKE